MFAYDSATRGQFDDATQQLLDRLDAKYGAIEIFEPQCARAKWFVRLTVPNRLLGPIPMGAAGRDVLTAARRLTVMLSLREDWNERRRS